jgi:hypothetical protein
VHCGLPNGSGGLVPNDRQGGDSRPPAGRARWTLTLLADALVTLTAHESLNGQQPRRNLG